MWGADCDGGCCWFVGLWRQRRRYCLDACGGAWFVAKVMPARMLGQCLGTVGKRCKGRGPKVISVCAVNRDREGRGWCKEIKEYRDMCPN